jgi:threonine/homoserine/homoserine lactone efflux protein
MGLPWPQILKTTRLSLQSLGVYIVTGAIAAGAFNDDDGFLKWFQRVWIVYLIGFIVAGGNAIGQRARDPLPPSTGVKP